MRKFKINDRVRLIGGARGGELGVIVDVNADLGDNHPYLVESYIDNLELWCDQSGRPDIGTEYWSSMELIESNSPSTLNGYQKLSAKYVKESAMGIVGWVVGLAGETGEVAELIKKTVIRQGCPPNKELLTGELGDVLWYLTQIATASGIKLEDIAEYNLQKLEKRNETT